MQDDGHPGNGPVTITRRLARPPEAIWAAVTEAECIAAWWGGYVSLEARPGGAFREVWRDDTGREVVTTGTVDIVDPLHRLSLSWKDADWPAETRVTVQIGQDGSGAVLTLRHEGWDLLGPDGAALRQAHEAGWRHHLDNLAAFLEASS